MRKNLSSSLGAVVTIGALTALLSVAGARPAAAQSIINQIAGIQQIDGTYLWQYEVTSGTGPAISHWTLTMCENAFGSLLAGSITGTNAGKIEFVSPDPRTGVTGLKFDEGFDDGESRTITFRLSQDWEPVLTTAKTKSGQQIDSFTVLAPSCELRENKTAIPEPGTMELALAVALPLAGVVLYRRRRRSPAAAARCR